MLPSNTAADAAYSRGKSPTLLERKRGNENTLRGTMGQLWAVLGLLILAVPDIYPPASVTFYGGSTGFYGPFRKRKENRALIPRSLDGLKVECGGQLFSCGLHLFQVCFDIEI